MNLPRRKSTETQLRLFEKPVKSIGSFRNIAGNIAERLTSIVTASPRLVTDCRCPVCPDVQYSDDIFFESKSVGKTNSVIVYEHRMHKDREFFVGGKELHYFVWRHNSRVEGIETEEGVCEAIVDNLVCLFVFDIPTLEDCLKDCEVRKLNSLYYSNHGKVWKGMGYRFHTKLILIVQVSAITINGKPVPVYISNPSSERFLRVCDISLKLRTN